jgi:hypothetical protein
MKPVVVLVSAIATIVTLSAQQANSIPRSEADERIFGWMRVLNLPSVTQPLTVDHRVYTPAQLSVANNFANWIQQSYVPAGGLGEVIRSVSEKLSPYNQWTKSRPQSYGAYAKIYTELKYGAAKKVEPASNSHVLWSVMANGVFGEPALNLSTPEQYYFTLPSFTDQGFGDDLEKAADLSRHPVLGKYPSYFARNSVTGNQKVIVLAKDNRLPFVKLTKGEYLDALGAAIAQWYEKERARVTQAEQGDKVRIARWMAPVDERHQKRLAALAVNRERYKARLQEVAEIADTEPNIALENFPDAFLGTGGSPLRLPVYKVDPALAARAKDGPPQWIVVLWTAQLNDPVSKRLHDAVVNNFNFEFIQNLFFAPERVAGQSYAPLKDPAATAPVATTAASATSKSLAADPNLHFFDDFSTTPVGKPPIGWKSTLNNSGASSVVATLDGVAGRWATTTGFTLTPGQLKTPLPADFTISYDLIASRDYTWGAQGMTFTLSSGAGSGFRGSFVSLRLRPGSGNADGEAELEADFPKNPGYLSRSKWFKVPGFSNQAQARAAVTIVKQGERLEVFLNKVKVFESDKAIPAGFLFQQVSLNHGGTFNANDRMFVGNLTILKK